MSRREVTRRVHPQWAAQLILALSAAGALKFYYSEASVNDLRWILAPTATIVDLVTGAGFTFEPYAGYINADRNFLIAAACAGVNFLIAAFLLLSLGRLTRSRGQKVRWRYFIAAGIVSYVATVIANTVRISIAMWLNTSFATFDSDTREEVHRLEGIVIYFGFLLLLYWLVERARSTRQRGPVDLNRIFKWSIFPLLVYYAITLGVPLLNGAYRQNGFWTHSVFVLLIPPLIILALAAAAVIIDRLRPSKNHLR